MLLFTIAELFFWLLIFLFYNITLRLLVDFPSILQFFEIYLFLKQFFDKLLFIFEQMWVFLLNNVTILAFLVLRMLFVALKNGRFDLLDIFLFELFVIWVILLRFFIKKNTFLHNFIIKLFLNFLTINFTLLLSTSWPRRWNIFRLRMLQINNTTNFLIIFNIFLILALIFYTFRLNLYIILNTFILIFLIFYQSITFFLNFCRKWSIWNISINIILKFLLFLQSK